MKQLFILLTACTLIAPAALAEEVGPVSCDPGLEEGSCTVSYALNEPDSGHASSAHADCPSVIVSYNLKGWLPADANPNIECIHYDP